MKKIVSLILLAFACNTQAQSIRFNNEQVFSEVSPSKKFNLDENGSKFDKEQNSFTCGGVKFPLINSSNKNVATPIHYDITVTDQNNNVNNFSANFLSNSYTPISATKTQSYLAFATHIYNPSTNSQERRNQPYVWKYETKDVTTGLFMVIYPMVQAGNITTHICFEKSELLDMKKVPYHNISLDLPEIKTFSGLKQINSESGKEIILQLHPDLTIKVKANLNTM